MQDLLSIIDNETFNKFFYESEDNVVDIEWCLTLNNIPLINNLTMNITKLKNKKAVNLAKQVLLSSHYSTFSKFCVTKNAIASGNYKYIDLTSNFVFRSFKVNVPAKYKKNNVLINAIANARAYVECYANKININNELHYISNLVLKKSKIELDEYSLACSFFYQCHSILSDVCEYFNVPIHSVQNVLNTLGIE